MEKIRLRIDLRCFLEDGKERIWIRSFFVQSIYRTNAGQIYKKIEKRRKIGHIALKRVLKLWKLLRKCAIIKEIVTRRKMCI